MQWLKRAADLNPNNVKIKQWDGKKEGIPCHCSEGSQKTHFLWLFPEAVLYLNQALSISTVRFAFPEKRPSSHVIQNFLRSSNVWYLQSFCCNYRAACMHCQKTLRFSQISSRNKSYPSLMDRINCWAVCVFLAVLHYNWGIRNLSYRFIGVSGGL